MDSPSQNSQPRRNVYGPQLTSSTKLALVVGIVALIAIIALYAVKNLGGSDKPTPRPVADASNNVGQRDQRNQNPLQFGGVDVSGNPDVAGDAGSEEAGTGRLPPEVVKLKSDLDSLISQAVPAHSGKPYYESLVSAIERTTKALQLLFFNLALEEKEFNDFLMLPRTYLAMRSTTEFDSNFPSRQKLSALYAADYFSRQDATSEPFSPYYRKVVADLKDIAVRVPELKDFCTEVRKMFFDVISNYIEAIHSYDLEETLFGEFQPLEIERDIQDSLKKEIESRRYAAASDEGEAQPSFGNCLSFEEIKRIPLQVNIFPPTVTPNICRLPGQNKLLVYASGVLASPFTVTFIADFETGEVRKAFNFDPALGDLFYADFTNDGSRLACSFSGGTVTLYEVTYDEGTISFDESKSSLLTTPGETPFVCRFSSDDDCIVLSNDSKLLCVDGRTLDENWRITDDSIVKTILRGVIPFDVHPEKPELLTMAMSAGDETIFRIRIIDIATGQSKFEFDTGETFTPVISSLYFGKNGNTIHVEAARNVGLPSGPDSFVLSFKIDDTKVRGMKRSEFIFPGAGFVDKLPYHIPLIVDEESALSVSYGGLFRRNLWNPTRGSFELYKIPSQFSAMNIEAVMIEFEPRAFGSFGLSIDNQVIEIARISDNTIAGLCKYRYAGEGLYFISEFIPRSN
ncbi:MAG: hypothetical protein NUW37_18895 [Planctomycetes bacterium]|nr:hypothetical protein [Planctomycetota bacterium]